MQCVVHHYQNRKNFNFIVPVSVEVEYLNTKLDDKDNILRNKKEEVDYLKTTVTNLQNKNKELVKKLGSLEEKVAMRSETMDGGESSLYQVPEQQLINYIKLLINYLKLCKWRSYLNKNIEVVHFCTELKHISLNRNHKNLLKKQ